MAVHGVAWPSAGRYVWLLRMGLGRSQVAASFEEHGAVFIDDFLDPSALTELWEVATVVNRSNGWHGLMRSRV